MAFDSMLYTMGTALSRAMDSDTEVQLLVQGQWIAGHVLAVDGVGLILNHSNYDHYFVRVEQISAVRVMEAAPTGNSTPIPSGPLAGVPDQRGADL